jgi:hypothetical protein
MDLDTPAYFASDAARAAGIDMLTFQNWLKRDAFGFTPQDRVGKGAGSRHLFTFRSVFILALTAEMVRNGITPQNAYRVASGAFKESHRENKTEIYIIVFPGGTKSVETMRGKHFSVEDIFNDPAFGDAASFVIIDPVKIKRLIEQRLGEVGA